MAIALAVQKGNIVYVYDERNRQMFTHVGELHSFTGSIVTLKKGNLFYMFDERGRQTGTRPIR
jgi:hypothetical protein